jgi:hypothetical protein
VPYSRRSSFREPYNHHTRTFSRNSVEAPPHHVRNFSRQSDAVVSLPRIEGGLMASVSEVVQHNAALNRMAPPTPLDSIENTYGRNQQTKSAYEHRHNGESFSEVGQPNRKENSPMKSDKPMTPSRKSSFSSQAGGQGSKRKQNKRAQVSRQNS